MKCFNHVDIEAVGICKSCMRGICKDCLVDLGDGLACRNKCEKKVEMISKSWRTARQIGSSAYKSNAIYFLMIGVISIVFGWTVLEETPLMFFLLSAGIVCLIGSWNNYQMCRKYKNEFSKA